MSSFNRVLFFLGMSVCLISCEFQCSVGNTKKNNSSTASAEQGTTISNNIQLTSSKVQVKEAYLIYGESGKKVALDNTADLGQKIKLLLVIGDGWVMKDNKVSIGASEQISTSTGQEIVNAEDLFASYNDGIDPADAKIISLSAMITKETGDIDHYNVKFRVWDKYGTGEINGSYKFFIRH